MNYKTIDQLVDLIKRDKNALPNHYGDTPLILYSDKVEQASTRQKSRLKNCFLQLAEHFSEFSTEDLGHLFAFLENSALPYLSEIAQHYQAALDRPALQGPANLAKRAALVQFVGENRAYSLQALEKEVEVKEHHFWCWFDAASSLDLPFAQSALLTYFQKHPSPYEMDGLIIRLPSLSHDFGHEKCAQFIQSFSSVLPKESYARLKYWLKLHPE